MNGQVNIPPATNKPTSVFSFYLLFPRALDLLDWLKTL